MSTAFLSSSRKSGTGGVELRLQAEGTSIVTTQAEHLPGQRSSHSCSSLRCLDFAHARLDDGTEYLAQNLIFHHLTSHQSWHALWMLWRTRGMFPWIAASHLQRKTLIVILFRQHQWRLSRLRICIRHFISALGRTFYGRYYAPKESQLLFRRPSWIGSHCLFGILAWIWSDSGRNRHNCCLLCYRVLYNIRKV